VVEPYADLRQNTYNVTCTIIYDTQQKYAIVNSDIYDRAKLIDLITKV